ncbi:MAG: 2-oxoglutarate dehydrogenase complex dihydrolipoyllysine-residue succinyltransferase [Verrucomicrobiota bacterium]|nr:2-oxoglutarate dehydrogenase complex dihydrolipoyllysine-residue succinyltransferase [Verrucomicrobiota bacterium]
MATEVKVPPMGESVSSGVLATWRVKDGDTVKAGQSLYDLETDKITQEGTAESAGVIRLKVAVGTEVKVGAVLAVIETAGGAPAPVATPTVAPAAAAAAPAKSVATGPKADFPPSPAVRRVAAETGIDPATVEGTGKAGRVTKGDMLSAAPAPVATAPVPTATPTSVAAAPVQAAVAVAGTSERVSRTRMSPLRKKIAERLISAQHTAAILTTFNEVDMSAVMELRKKHQDAFVAKHGIKLGFMSFFVKAVVNALHEVPAINAQVDGDEIVQNHFYDVGVAVSTPRGLMVPVVRNCDALSMAGVEKAIAAYGQKAKEGKIAIDDLQGGVFTISNGGIFGSMLSTPILNPPQSGILGLHAIKDRPMAVNGQVVIRPMMYLALSYDHRIVDGREAVTFLIKVKDAIEEPTRLLLEV